MFITDFRKMVFEGGVHCPNFQDYGGECLMGGAQSDLEIQGGLGLIGRLKQFREEKTLSGLMH